MNIREFDVTDDELHARARQSSRSINPASPLPAPTITVDVDVYPELKEQLLQRGWHVAMTGKEQSTEALHEKRSTIELRKLLTWYEWCVMQHDGKWFILENAPPDYWKDEDGDL